MKTNKKKRNTLEFCGLSANTLPLLKGESEDCTPSPSPAVLDVAEMLSPPFLILNSPPPTKHSHCVRRLSVLSETTWKSLGSNPKRLVCWMDASLIPSHAGEIGG